MTTDTKSNVEKRKAIELELSTIIHDDLEGYPGDYQFMLQYQLGLDEAISTGKARGKRIRPLLVLLACQAAGGAWQQALPAAAAVELMHNFSLIHDDIQDSSEIRRGRPTVWKKWGEALAINAGDAMLTLANLSILKLGPILRESERLKAAEMLHLACLNLTHGQHLDIAYEDLSEITLELYWQMVEGKTGALLGTSLGLGALIAGKTDDQVMELVHIGKKIGRAFQVQDDWLGIWGNDQETGKSTSTDLTSKKKTYPVLLGLQNKSAFYHEWMSGGEFTYERGKALAGLLQKEGVDEKTTSIYATLYDEVLRQLNGLGFDPEITKPLIVELKGLFNRIH